MNLWGRLNAFSFFSLCVWLQMNFLRWHKLAFLIASHFTLSHKMWSFLSCFPQLLLTLACLRTKKKVWELILCALQRGMALPLCLSRRIITLHSVKQLQCNGTHSHRMKMLQSSNFKRHPPTHSQPARPLTLHLLVLNVKIRVVIALRYVLGQRLIPIFGRCAALLPYIVAIMSFHALLATLFFTLDDFLCRLFVLFLFEFYAVLEVVLPWAAVERIATHKVLLCVLKICEDAMSARMRGVEIT